MSDFGCVWYQVLHLPLYIVAATRYYPVLSLGKTRKDKQSSQVELVPCVRETIELYLVLLIVPKGTGKTTFFTKQKEILSPPSLLGGGGLQQRLDQELDEGYCIITSSFPSADHDHYHYLCHSVITVYYIAEVHPFTSNREKL